MPIPLVLHGYKTTKWFIDNYSKTKDYRLCFQIWSGFSTGYTESF